MILDFYENSSIVGLIERLIVNRHHSLYIGRYLRDSDQCRYKPTFIFDYFCTNNNKNSNRSKNK